MRAAAVMFRAVAGAAAVVAWTAVPASGAAPVSGLATGSWWADQLPGGVLPPPPTVPSGGLWVSATPAGDNAVSAVRFRLDGAQAPVLHLKVHQAQPASSVAIVACPVTAAAASWKAESAGPWSDRPAADCGTHAAAVLSSDRATAAIDLSGIPAVAGAVDVVLQPAAGAVFDATFEPVRAADITALVPAATAPPAAVAPPAAGPQPAPAAGPQPVPAAADFPAPVPDVAPVPASPAAAPPPAPATTIAPGLALRPAEAAAEQAGTAAHGMSRRTRWLLAMIVLDLAIFASWQGWLDPGRQRRRVTLYDPVPAPVDRPVRIGKAPPLR